MRSKRWLVGGIIASCFAVPLVFACGNDTFSAAPEDASNSETSSDGTAPDSPTSVGDGAVFCTPQPTQILCADFDEVDDLRSGLTANGFTAFFATTATTDGGDIFRSANGVSAPSALDTSIVAVGTDASAQCQTAGILDDQPDANHFRLSMSIRFDNVGDVGGPGSLELFTFALSGAGTTTYQVVVNTGHVALAVVAGSNFEGGFDLGQVPSDKTKWLPFVVDVTIGANGKVTASLGSENGTLASSTNLTEHRPTLALGMYSSGGTGALGVSFDNVEVYADKVDAGVGVSVMDAGHD
jgi:hypothetical protein